MRAPSFQPTLHKICAGDVHSPKRASALRIAAHFGIPVDAIYDDGVATRLYEQMRGEALAPPASAPALTTSGAPVEAPQRGTQEVLQELARLLAEVPTAPRRSAIAALLASFAHEPGAPEYIEMLAIALRPGPQLVGERRRPNHPQDTARPYGMGSSLGSIRTAPDPFMRQINSNWNFEAPDAPPEHAP